MELTIQNKFSDVATITSTGFLANCIDLLETSGPGPENQLDPLVCVIPFASTPGGGGTNTYQVQIINDTATNGTTAPVVVADTGVISSGDQRLANPDLALPIDWNLVNLRYLMVKVFIAGNASPSFAINGAWLQPKSSIPANVLVAANYAI